jgi:hypothetical protein
MPPAADSSGVQLQEGDLAWLRGVRKVVDRSSPAFRDRRKRLVRELRHRVRADYVFWGVGLHDFARSQGLLLDCFTDADESATTGADGPLEAGTWELFKELDDWYERNELRGVTCSRVGHRMNADKLSIRFVTDLLRADQQLPEKRPVDVPPIPKDQRGERIKYVTAEKSFLLKQLSWWDKLQALTRLGLMRDRARLGLDDFLFSMCRISDDAASGLGLHRRVGQPPFSQRDVFVVDQVMRANDDLLNHVTMDANPFRGVSLNLEERKTLPLIMCGDFTEAEIGFVLGVAGSHEVSRPGEPNVRRHIDRMRHRTKETVRSIARKIGVAENLRALQALSAPPAADPTHQSWREPGADWLTTRRQFGRP